MPKSLLRLAVLALCFAGCCNQQPPGAIDLSKLPPPITLEEQVARLNARSAALPRIKAAAAVRGVELRWLENGHQKTENFEGTLLLRQHPESPTAPTTDLQLSGQAFEREVLLAGENATDWWCIVRLDVNKAWTGDSRAPIRWSRRANASTNTALVRVDPIPDLLGITPLTTALGRTIVLRVDDFRGTNDLFIEDLTPSYGNPPAATLRREIIINRFTGDIDEVRLYDSQGIMAVRSQLSDYRPVETPTASDATTPAPRMPFHIHIDYPAQKTTINLQFDKITIPAKLNDASFETPDFAGQNLKVIHVE